MLGAAVDFAGSTKAGTLGNFEISRYSGGNAFSLDSRSISETGERPPWRTKAFLSSKGMLRVVIVQAFMPNHELAPNWPKTK